MENNVNAPKDDAFDLPQKEQWFEAAQDATISARTEGERARDYLDGAQLTAEEIAALEKRGQPTVIMNRIRRKVEWLLGLEVKQRTDPKAFPRTPNHEQGAEAATDAIRYVCDNVDWDETRTEVYDNMLVEGYGGAEVIHKQNAKGGIDIAVNHYPWDRLFYDPHSRKPDFSDARYKGIVLWMDKVDFDRAHPKHTDAVDDVALGVEDTYDDKPANIWYDHKRKRVRVILMWYKDDGWKWCKFIKGALLAGGESPYMNEDGETICPLILQSAYVSRNNDRYGVIRDMFSPQDEINKRRSKALHLLTMRQVEMTKGVADPASIRRELAKADGLIEHEAGPDDTFLIHSNNDLAAGQAQLLVEAKEEIDMLGANSALAGETGESASGRAVLARQQGGMIEIAHLNDRLHHFTREIYRQIWYRVRQFWTEEKWLRVTDEESNARFVSINRPIPFGEALGQLPEEEAAAIAQQIGLVPDDPRLQQPIGMENAVEEIDVDILIEEAPDRITLAGEMFEALLKYGQTLPPAVLIEADPTLPSKKKEKLLELMQNQQPSPEQQLEIAAKGAGVEKTTAETAKIQAETMPLQAV